MAARFIGSREEGLFSSLNHRANETSEQRFSNPVKFKVPPVKRMDTDFTS